MKSPFVQPERTAKPIANPARVSKPLSDTRKERLYLFGVKGNIWRACARQSRTNGGPCLVKSADFLIASVISFYAQCSACVKQIVP